MNAIDETFAELVRANPVPGDAQRTHDGWIASELLHEIDARSTVMNIKLEPELETEPRSGASAEDLPPLGRGIRPRGGLLAVAAAAVVVVIVAVSLFGSDEDNSLVETIATPDQSLPEAALATADAYFAAFNAGDPSSVLALFAPGGVTVGELRPESAISSPTFDQYEMFLYWNAGQGARYTTPDCEAQAPQDGVVFLTCRTDTVDALIDAVDHPGAATELTFQVTADGISSLGHRYFHDPAHARSDGSSDNPSLGTGECSNTRCFADTELRFDLWVQGTFLGAEEFLDVADVLMETALPVGFTEWTTTDEASAAGSRRAEFAQQWGEFVDASGCLYFESPGWSACGQSPDE